MVINDTYGKNEIVFSRSAKDLLVSEAEDSLVNITVSVDSEVVASFAMAPLYNRIVLNLSGILESCSVGQTPSAPSRSSYSYVIRRVKITAGNQSWTHPVLFGIKPTRKNIDKYDFLTRRQEMVYTYRDSIEPMASRWLPAGVGSGVTLMAEVSFMTHLPVRVVLSGPMVLPSSSDMYMGQLDCSYSTILAATNAAGYSDEVITGWKVWLKCVTTSLDGSQVVTEGSAQRFELRTGFHRTYVFRNIYGFFDIIHATGAMVILPESEVATFINNNLECELSNDTALYFEQNTGYIGSASQTSLWLEFLSSSERYVLEDSIVNKIIVDESDAKITKGELSSLKFKWHYADRNNNYKI